VQPFGKERKMGHLRNHEYRRNCLHGQLGKEVLAMMLSLTTAAFFPVWLLGHLHQNHEGGIDNKLRFWGLIPDLLNQNLWGVGPGNLHFFKCPRFYELEIFGLEL